MKYLYPLTHWIRASGAKTVVSIKRASALLLLIMIVFQIQEIHASSFSSSLTGYWSLDGNTSDQSINHNNLNIVDDFQASGAHWIPKWTRGHTNSALNLSGWVRIAFANDTTALQTPSVTMSAWVYPKSKLVGDEWGIWRQWEWIVAQGDNYGLFLSSENRGISFYIKNTSGGWSSAYSENNHFEYDKWQHIAGSFDAVTHTLKVYKNGVEVGSHHVDSDIEYSTGDGFTVGSMQNDRNFNGIIDEVKIFKAALTHAHIEQLAESTNSLFPTSTGKLNDTGVTQCGDYGVGRYTANNKLDCVAVDPADGDPIPPAQDALSGRDANSRTNSDSDGHAGFDFTKLTASGAILDDQSATSFNCVKDNVTGLIWEVKTTAGLHNMADGYNWYNTDASTNGGNEGFNGYGHCSCVLGGGKDNSCYGFDGGNSASYCNTEAYVARVNAAGWCGAKDWRLPTRKELLSLVDFSKAYPAIDTDFFPNTGSGRYAHEYWSSTPIVGGGLAWRVYFTTGRTGGIFKYTNTKLKVRLVRGGL